MLDLVVVDGQARGIVTRNLVTGELESHAGHAVLLCTGGYGTVFYLSTNAVNSNVTAAWRAHKRGAFFANPCFTQIHPTCIPVSGDHQSKLTLMSESLRNDGRVWVPKTQGDKRVRRRRFPTPSATTTSSAGIRASATWCRATSRRAPPRRVCDEGRGVGESGLSVYLDFADAIKRLGADTIAGRYGNLFDMYKQHHRRGSLPGADAHLPGRPLHDGRPVGGLQPDERRFPGLFVLGEANFSDHGANRLGASALMQGLADGYFVAPYTRGQLPRRHRARGGADRATTPSGSGGRRRRRASTRCWP